jgi:hypothetical protein
MSRKILIALSAAALLGSCAQEATPAPNVVKDLMKSTVDPQAQILWKAAGSYSDESGFHDLRPTTEEGWKAAQDAARAVAEAGRLMQTAPYAEGRGEGWMAFTRGLTEMAERNEKGLADRLSDDELLKLGGDLYNVCKACHEAYPPAEPLPDE